MALFDFFRARSKAKAKSPVARRRKRKTESGSALLHWLENNKVVTVALFVLTVAAIFIISFVGVSPAAFHILPNQEATIRIIADTDFSYQSALLTARKKERLLKEVAPVYRVDQSALERFDPQIRQILSEMNALEARWQELSEPERLQELTNIADAANSKGGLQIGVRELATLMNFGDAAARERLIVDNGLYYVRVLQRAGIYNPETAATSGDGKDRQITLFNVQRESGNLSSQRVSTVEEALVTLRASLSAENVPQAVATALFRLLRPGITENLVFDMEKTESFRTEMLETMESVVINVEAGQSIIEPGTKVSAEQYEMLTAYKQHLNSSSQLPSGLNQQLVGRILLVLGVIIVACFYIRLEDP
ncbi:MAG: hypothetical protein ACREIA_03505, partial [Opitutaceae bacterium]